uniref:Glycosyl transferase 64 domain-containing protein n=1 Tax=Kalanchoe fedtschenkoi TaxID=63787 RepID=A0A7N0THD0_KALFE
MRGSFVNLNRRTVQRFRQFAVWSAGSLRMKIILCFCLIVSLTLLASRDSSAWADESDPVAQLSASSKGYTLLINTWKRYDLLKRSVSHYASCSKIDSIHIVWSEPNPPSEGLKRFLSRVVTINSRKSRKVELKFDIHKEDSLNNRFKEIKDLTTDAVFSIDDDIIFPCSSVDFAFTVWQSAPDTMVGFVPRMHWIDQTSDTSGQFVYKGWWSVWWRGTYSMVLTKAAFLHKKYLKLYTNDLPSSIKEYITKNRNCEDIAMSFLVANVTGSPPIWVQGKINEIGSTGISSLGGHTEKRSECVNWFAAEFGRMPLVPTSLKAVDSRRSWLW